MLTDANNRSKIGSSYSESEFRIDNGVRQLQTFRNNLTKLNSLNYLKFSSKQFEQV